MDASIILALIIGGCLALVVIITTHTPTKIEPARCCDRCLEESEDDEF